MAREATDAKARIKQNPYPEDSRKDPRRSLGVLNTPSQKKLACFTTHFLDDFDVCMYSTVR